MAQVSREELNEVVSRVTAEVLRETKGYERGVFEVADLRTHLAELAKVGGESAWEISYKTTSAPTIEGLKDLARLGGESAWEISYKTTSAPAIEKAEVSTPGKRQAR